MGSGPTRLSLRRVFHRVCTLLELHGAVDVWPWRGGGISGTHAALARPHRDREGGFRLGTWAQPKSLRVRKSDREGDFKLIALLMPSNLTQVQFPLDRGKGCGCEEKARLQNMGEATLAASRTLVPTPGAAWRPRDEKISTSRYFSKSVEDEHTALPVSQPAQPASTTASLGAAAFEGPNLICHGTDRPLSLSSMAPLT